MRQKRFSLKPLDVLVSVLSIGACLYLAYRVKVGLHYQWHWETLTPYLFRCDPQEGWWIPGLLMDGFFTTIRLSVWGTLLATLMGTAMGLCRVSRGLFKRLLGRSYVELIRNTPPMVLIFMVYFFFSDLILGFLGIERLIISLPEEAKELLSLIFAPPLMFSAFLSAVLTLAIFEGAFIAEIVRAGIQSIETGQWHAAQALGLSRWQQMRHVILPQAIKRVLPPLAGQFISTIKDSAIVSVISIQELTFQGMELMSATFLRFEVWIAIAAMYFLLTFSLSLPLGRLEIRMKRSGA